VSDVSQIVAVLQLVAAADAVAVTTRLYPPHILWQSPTQQIAMRGETWSVKCIFAGRWVVIRCKLTIVHYAHSTGDDFAISTTKHKFASADADRIVLHSIIIGQLYRVSRVCVAAQYAKLEANAKVSGTGHTSPLWNFCTNFDVLSTILLCPPRSSYAKFDLNRFSCCGSLHA